MLQLKGFRGGSKDAVLRHHGFVLVERPRKGYSVYQRKGWAGGIDVAGHGTGAMWYHRTGEPAQPGYAPPNHSFGRTAQDLHLHLMAFAQRTGV